MKDRCDPDTNFKKKNTTNISQLRWSNFVCSNSTSAIPHLEFSLVIQSNNLTYQGNPYTKYQQFLYILIKSLHDKGYGYRRIAHKLNKWNKDLYRKELVLFIRYLSLKEKTRKRCQNTRDTQ